MTTKKFTYELTDNLQKAHYGNTICILPETLLSLLLFSFFSPAMMFAISEVKEQ